MLSQLASNAYEEPRPPRRGSHRPGRVLISTSSSREAERERLIRSCASGTAPSPWHVRGLCVLELPPNGASLLRVSHRMCLEAACRNMAVSRGLCRGHGGGRRCVFTGCTKSAQSRSRCCWAHGGGQRCAAVHCMRSRKSKHFCGLHATLEKESLTQWKALPSLAQALLTAQRHPPALPTRATKKSWL